jgi:exopolysaccharide production protein ExoZ
LPLRAGLALLAGIITLGAAACPFPSDQHWVLKYWSDPVMLEFLLGIGLAGLFMRGARLSVRQGALLALGGFALLLAATAWPDRSLPLRFLWAGIPAAMTCAGFALAPQPTRGHWLYDRAVRIAAAGYVLFLAHPFVINLVALAWRKADAHAMLLFVPATLAASMAVAVLAHRWLEKPLNRLLDKPRRRKSEIAGSPALVPAE